MTTDNYIPEIKQGFQKYAPVEEAEIEAVQFDGTWEMANAITVIPSIDIYEPSINDPFAVLVLRNYDICRSGDWIIRKGFNDYKVLNNTVFNMKYRLKEKQQ